MSQAERAEIHQGTLALLVLMTLESMGPLHGYGIARRRQARLWEQTVNIMARFFNPGKETA